MHDLVAYTRGVLTKRHHFLILVVDRETKHGAEAGMGLSMFEGKVVVAHKLLRNSCPYTIYPTFSSLPMKDPISPSTNSSPHRTDTRTHPHSSPTPLTSETRSVPILDTSSCFTFPVLIRFTLPPVLWSAGLHFVSRMFSSLDSAAAPHPLRSTGSPYRFPFLHRMILYLVFSLVQRCGSLP